MARAGIAQFSGRLNPEENLATLQRLVEELATSGADIICFQELSTTVYFCTETDARFFEWAQPIPGPATNRMVSLAQDHDVGIVFPLFEKAGGVFFNSLVIIDSGKGIIGKYRKLHIPMDIGALGEHSGFEKFYFSPGDLGLPVFELKGVRLGCVICYDRHFPEGVRSLALQGAQLLVVPTATPTGSQRFWQAELIAHAVQNGIFVVGINRAGVDEEGEDVFFGNSSIIAPDGSILLELGGEEGVGVADIDVAKVDDWRISFGILRDRRPECYEAVMGPL
jgi:predicted amidohydrolase